MKIYYLYFVLVLFTISCDSPISEPETAITPNKISRETNDYPFNPSNSFDSAGQIHNEILTSYYEHNPLPTETDSIISLFHLKAMSHPFFSSPNSSVTTPILMSDLQPLLANPNDVLLQFLDSSTLSEKAKINLKYYIQELLLASETSEDYATIYDYIINYEAQVEANTDYTSNDKAIILTITSITRHSVYMKKKKPKKNTDPDWDWLTTNVIGASAGASGDVHKAIYTALIAGIIENR